MLKFYTFLRVGGGGGRWVYWGAGPTKGTGNSNTDGYHTLWWRTVKFDVVTHKWTGLVSVTKRLVSQRGVALVDRNFMGSPLLDLERPNSAWQHIRGGASFSGEPRRCTQHKCVARFVSDSCISSFGCYRGITGTPRYNLFDDASALKFKVRLLGCCW